VGLSHRPSPKIRNCATLVIVHLLAYHPSSEEILSQVMVLVEKWQALEERANPQRARRLCSFIALPS